MVKQIKIIKISQHWEDIYLITDDHLYRHRVNRSCEIGYVWLCVVCGLLDGCWAHLLPLVGLCATGIIPACVFHSLASIYYHFAMFINFV